MKGICIDDKDQTIPTIFAGEEYILEPATERYNIPAYWLPEVGYHFAQHRFAPLSDIDERDRIEEVMEKMFEPVKINK